MDSSILAATDRQAVTESWSSQESDGCVVAGRAGGAWEGSVGRTCVCRQLSHDRPAPGGAAAHAPGPCRRTGSGPGGAPPGCWCAGRSGAGATPGVEHSQDTGEASCQDRPAPAPAPRPLPAGRHAPGGPTPRGASVRTRPPPAGAAGRRSPPAPPPRSAAPPPGRRPGRRRAAARPAGRTRRRSSRPSRRRARRRGSQPRVHTWLPARTPPPGCPPPPCTAAGRGRTGRASRPWLGAGTGPARGGAMAPPPTPPQRVRSVHDCPPVGIDLYPKSTPSPPGAVGWCTRGTWRLATTWIESQVVTTADGPLLGNAARPQPCCRLGASTQGICTPERGAGGGAFGRSIFPAARADSDS